MSTKTLTLMVQPTLLGICPLDAAAPVPDWACNSEFFSVTRTPDELSVVCAQESIPAECPGDKGWVGLKVSGPLDLSAIGILSSLTVPLAKAGIAVFALSTHATDYLLVRKADLPGAVKALSAAGHKVVP